ncbi:hypothetical protein [Flavobacterium alkalisoli]|uniref:hypothetical protein n=1 Tax=Flavobacterium alkalisoli TaxID=2602769 RepID=UPI003A91709F
MNVRLLKSALFAGLFVTALSLTSCGEKKDKDADMENMENHDEHIEDVDVDVDVNEDTVKVDVDTVMGP